MEPATKRRKLSSSAEDVVQASDSHDNDKRHSLFVRSLPASVTKERLIEHFSQSFPLKHATVVLDPTTKISRGFGFVTFTDAEDARLAQAEFNHSILDGRKIKVEPAEARNREVEEHIQGKSVSKNVKGEELRAKRQSQQDETQPPKLIVRNLPWSIKTSEDLTKLFLSYGKVKHAVVPKLPDKNGQAGFGIVILRGRKNAERALQGVNGKVVDGRPLAVDWAVDKETWQKVKESEIKAPYTGDVQEAAEEASETVLQDEAAASEPDSDSGAPIVDGEDDVTSDDPVNDDADLEDENDLLDQDVSDLEDDEDDANIATTTKFNTENTTVFIRNLPYDTDDETLLEHFKDNFGPVRYARVVYDHETERPRGTAFVCFRHEDDAKTCVKECTKQDTPVNNQPFNKGAPSILQNENADPTGKYTLGSRLLHVTRALPKVEADTRASEGETARRAKQTSDKRRLYLLSEGTVSPGSSLYGLLSKTELDIRASSAKQRQKLVKSNPNLGLSLTRLSIRNLPRWIDGIALKALAREAIVGFATDVKEGRRQPVSKEELARDGEAGRVAEQQRKAQGKGVVRQAKIVYESDKTGTKVGEGKGGRSRGYGFVEYWGHRSALMGLRWLNGHMVKKPKDIKDDDAERGKRLIVEFAIENAQVVQRRDDRERRSKFQRQRDHEKEDGDEDAGNGNGKARLGDKRKRGPQDDKKSGKKQETITAKEVVEDPKEQDAKNKVAARNRIIAQKRMKRRNRKG